METALLLSLGVALAQAVLRLSSNAGIADSVGDFAAAIDIGTRSRKRPDQRTQLLARRISAELEARLAGLQDPGDVRDVRSAVTDVAALFARLPRESLVEAVLEPKYFRHYLDAHGAREIVSNASRVAGPFADRLITAAGDIFVQVATDDPAFTATAVARIAVDQQRILQRLPREPGAAIGIAEAVSPAADPSLEKTTAERSGEIRGTLTPEILPPMVRAELIRSALGADDGMHVVLGEGGLGKSVLAGQIFDASADQRPTLLVNCARLRNLHRLENEHTIDAALGSQVTGAELLLSQVLPHLSPRPTLILDTLDIILREENADDVGALLRTYSAEADVIVLCRTREWQDLVVPQFGVASQPLTQVLPHLTQDEIIAWVKEFLARDASTAPSASDFLASVRGATQAQKGLRVLGLPLRLAMACRLYAKHGSLPEDLSATKLYDEYWTRRVTTARDGRSNTKAARATLNGALTIAGAIWAESTDRFIEDVAAVTVETTALNALLSEGVLDEVGYRVRFFHQTFAEFAVARYLAAQGNAGDLARLRLGLQAQVSGYWGIAGYLVHEKLSDERFEDVLSAIPLTVEGVRTVSLGVFSRSSAGAVDWLLSKLATDARASAAAAADILGDAPAEFAVQVADLLVELLGDGVDRLTGIVHALIALVTTTPPEARAQIYFSSVEALLGLLREDPERAGYELQRMVASVLLDAQASDLVDGTIALYDALPEPARRVVVEAVAREIGGSRSALLGAAIRFAVPSMSAEHLAKLAFEEWSHEGSRLDERWSDWTQMLREVLPGTWDAVQVRIVRWMASDADVRREVISECLRPTLELPRDRLVNAGRFVADDWPSETVELIEGIGVAHTRASLAGLCQLSLQVEPVITRDQRELLTSMIVEHASLDPRRAWPAAVKLSADSTELVSKTLRRLQHQVMASAGGVEWATVVSSSLDALVQVQTPSELASVQEVLRDLVASTPGADVDAGVVAALALVSPSVRADVLSEFASDRFRRQRKIALGLSRRKADWPVAETVALLGFCLDLLGTRNAGALIPIAACLGGAGDVDLWTGADTSAVVERLTLALNRAEEPQISGSLVELLARVSHGAPPAAHVSADQVASLVREFETALASAAEVDRRGSVFNQYARVLTAVAPTVLPIGDIADVVVRVAQEIDTADVTGKAHRTLARLVTGVLVRAPEVWPRFEAAWPAVSPANRQALAEAVASGKVPDHEVVAARLARRVDCPVGTAAYLHRRRRGE